MKTVIEHVSESRIDTDELIRLAKARDLGAFEALYRLHYRRVHALSLRLTANSGRAEELTQEVFVRAWTALPGFRGDSQLGTWLHTITVRAHTAIERRVRRIESREVPESDVGSFAFAIRRSMPETDIDLERAISRLPKGARQVLVLHDIQGYKHREIGEMLGVSEGTSKTQLHRARKIIRSLLEPTPTTAKQTTGD